MRYEVRFSGFGGQGIILSAVIIGRAAVMYDNKFAVQTQVYGPEARGGACWCLIREEGGVEAASPLEKLKLLASAS